MNGLFELMRMAVVPPAASGGGEAMTLRETVEIDASVDRTWAAMGDFGNMSWHPAIGRTEIARGRADEIGAARVLTLKEGGGKIHETLTSHSAGHAYGYDITESVLPVRDYSANIKVEAAGAGSRVVWTATFKRKDPAASPATGQDDATAKTVVTGILQSGLANLKRQVEF